ncbi:MAG TPA: hypothetical protein VH561_12940 [Micromonosporaceae bacterium]|jgi:23S rRNA G2445 N2-methylase RlmL
MELAPELAELESLMKRAESAQWALHDLTEESRAVAASTWAATATDATGSVRASTDADGVLGSIELSSDWRLLVGAERFAGAVTEACQNAVQAGVMAWAKVAEKTGLDRRLREVLEYLDGTAAPPSWMQARGPRPPFPTASMSAATESDDLRAALTTGESSGVAAQGKLTVTIDLAGVATCQADPGWVSRQNTAQLNENLAAALASARGRFKAWKR